MTTQQIAAGALLLAALWMTGLEQSLGIREGILSQGNYVQYWQVSDGLVMRKTAAANQWQRLDPPRPQGNPYFKVDTRGAIWALDEKLYRLSNDGESWEQTGIPTTEARDFCVAPAIESDKLIVVRQGGMVETYAFLHKSRNSYLVENRQQSEDFVLACDAYPLTNGKQEDYHAAETKANVSGKNWDKNREILSFSR